MTLPQRLRPPEVRGPSAGMKSPAPRCNARSPDLPPLPLLPLAVDLRPARAQLHASLDRLSPQLTGASGAQSEPSGSIARDSSPAMRPSSHIGTRVRLGACPGQLPARSSPSEPSIYYAPPRRDQGLSMRPTEAISQGFHAPSFAISPVQQRTGTLLISAGTLHLAPTPSNFALKPVQL